MFKNSEGYADPTAGAALAHIAYEERQRAKEAYRIVSDAAQKERGVIRQNHHEHWVKVWPKDKVIGRVGKGGKGK